MLEELRRFLDIVALLATLEHGHHLLDELDSLLRRFFKLAHAIYKLRTHHEVAALLREEYLREDCGSFWFCADNATLLLTLKRLLRIKLDHAKGEQLVRVPLLMTRLLTKALVNQWQAANVSI